MLTANWAFWVMGGLTAVFCLILWAGVTETIRRRHEVTFLERYWGAIILSISAFFVLGCILEVT